MSETLEEYVEEYAKKYWRGNMNETLEEYAKEYAKEYWRQEAIEIIKVLLEYNVPIDTIQEATRIDLDTILALQEEVNSQSTP